MFLNNCHIVFENWLTSKGISHWVDWEEGRAESFCFIKQENTESVAGLNFTSNWPETTIGNE